MSKRLNTTNGHGDECMTTDYQGNTQAQHKPHRVVMHKQMKYSVNNLQSK